MIVEGLVSDARRPGTTRVFIDGKVAWTVPSSVVVALQLAEGMRLSSAAVETLERTANEEAAYCSALRMLERRAHSTHELAHKLQRKGHTESAAAAAIGRLRDLELLDDLAFTRAYVFSRQQRGCGPARMRHDLARLGVDRAIVADVLAGMRQESEDPMEHARTLVMRRARQFGELSTDARRRRLTAFLARRGFAGTQARRLVEEAMAERSAD